MKLNGDDDNRDRFVMIMTGKTKVEFIRVVCR